MNRIDRMHRRRGAGFRPAQLFILCILFILFILSSVLLLRSNDDRMNRMNVNDTRRVNRVLVCHSRAFCRRFF
jgi:uncharacterized membrane protein